MDSGFDLSLTESADTQVEWSCHYANPASAVKSFAKLVTL